MSKLHPKHRITRKKLYFFIVSLPLLCAGLLFSLAIVNQKENLDPRSEAATLKRKKDKIDIKYEKLDSFKPPVFDPSSSYSTPPSTPYTTDFHNEPLIGMLSKNTFQVNLRAKEEGTMVSVQYGIGNLTSNTGIHTSTNANEQYNVLEIPLTGIQPNQLYKYRVSWKPPQGGIMMPGPIRTFRTPRSLWSNFKFGVSGDSQQTSHDYTNCIPNDLFDSFGVLREHMKTKNYDITLSVGDEWELSSFADNCQEDDEFTMENALLSAQYWRDDIDRMNYSIPHFMTPGNHNYDVEWDNNFRVDRAHKARLLSTINPLNNNPPDGDNETYYAFEWGDALFVSINTEFISTLGRTKHQYKWLENTLANSNANWKFIFMHRPLLGGLRPFPSENTKNFLMAMFANYRVDVVFQGHHHHFVCKTYNPDSPGDRCFTDLSKNSDNKTVYYVVTGAGGVNGPISSPGDLQYMDVSVQGNKAIVKCINPLTGNLCDASRNQFTITKNIQNHPTPTPAIPDPEPPPITPTLQQDPILPTPTLKIIFKPPSGKRCTQVCNIDGSDCLERCY